MTASGNILTDAPATWKALGWNLALLGDAVDAVPRVDADAKNFPIANWKDSIDNALNDFNDWVNNNATITGPLPVPQLLLAGGVTAGASALNDDLLAGDGVNTNIGMQWLVPTSGTVRWTITDAQGDFDGQFTWTGVGGGAMGLTMRLDDNNKYFWNATVYRPSAGIVADLGDPTQAWNEIHGQQLLLAGAGTGDAAASSDDGVFGDGVTDVGVTFNMGAGNAGRISWNNGTNDEHLQIRGSGNQLNVRVNNVDTFNMQAGVFRPITSSVDLGNATQNWDNIHGVTLLLGGAAKADADASSDDIVGGSTSTTNFGMTFVVDPTGGTGRFGVTGTAGSVEGQITYSLPADQWNFMTSGVNRALVDDNTFRPFTNGAMHLGQVATTAWGSLGLAERADHWSTPTAGRGEVWLRNDAPNTLMFTDDDANDYPLSLMPIISLHPETAFFPSVAPAAYSQDGTSRISSIVYTESGLDDEAYWNLTMPHQYNGQDLTFRLFWTSDAGAADSVRWSIRVERHNAGFDINASGFDSSVDSTQVGSATVGVITVSDIVFALANHDAIVAGEPFRVSIRRLDGHAGDTSTTFARLQHVQIFQNP